MFLFCFIMPGRVANGTIVNMKCGATENDGVFLESIGASIKAGNTKTFAQKLLDVMNTQPSKNKIMTDLPMLCYLLLL